MLNLFLEIANNLQMEVFELGVLIVFVLSLLLVAWFVRAARQSEIYRRFETQLSMLDNFLLIAITSVPGLNYDHDYYDAKADADEEETGVYIDPRMLYVLDQAEHWAKARGIQVELDELLVRAEGIYQNIIR